MTDTILRHPVSGPSAWKARDFAGDWSWIRTFSRQELDELHAATEKLQATGMGPEEFRREDFPLPTPGACPSIDHGLHRVFKALG